MAKKIENATHFNLTYLTRNCVDIYKSIYMSLGGNYSVMCIVYPAYWIGIPFVVLVAFDCILCVPHFATYFFASFRNYLNSIGFGYTFASVHHHTNRETVSAEMTT